MLFSLASQLAPHVVRNCREPYPGKCNCYIQCQQAPCGTVTHRSDNAEDNGEKEYRPSKSRKHPPTTQIVCPKITRVDKAGNDQSQKSDLTKNEMEQSMPAHGLRIRIGRPWWKPQGGIGDE